MAKKYNFFLSHSSLDKNFCDLLNKRLIQAGFHVWYDESSLIANTSLTSDLPKHISECESLIVVLSKNSYKSRWVEEEYNYAKNLMYQDELCIIPLVIDDCELPGFYNNYKWIDCREGLTSMSFFHILSSYYRASENLRGMVDIYVSYSWRKEERELVDVVFNRLRRKQYRIVGDATDQTSYDNDDRIRRIMKTCWGFIGIVPFREGSNTSRYILDEIQKAEECGLPGLLFADSRVEDLEEITNYPIVKIDLSTPINDNTIKDGITLLSPAKPNTPHVFYATELDEDREYTNNLIRNIAGFIVALPCILGEEVNRGNLQQQIVDRIRSAYVMIADISNRNGRYNTCIEAGIARGADRDLYLVAQGERHTPPFMFRDMNVRYYDNEVELMAIVHKILRPYRRKIIGL